MGAAAHLAAVPAPPPKRGGRGPEGYIETVHRIYADKRAGHEAKELLLAVAYAVGIAPAEEGRGPLNIAARLLGRDRIGRPRFDALMAADAPRYEASRSAQNWSPSQAPPCEAPRLRPYRPRGYQPRQTPTQDLLPGVEPPTPLRTPPPPILHVDPGYTPPRDWRNEDSVCGANSHHRVIERDPATGWVTARWFCRRHREHADRVTEQVRAQNEDAPPPIPNRGGLLPSYFAADWVPIYRHYSGQRWEPPTYGLAADDWPTPGQTSPVPARGRLRLLLGGTPDALGEAQ
ncbi:hypothetical protein [Streptomyces sp. CC224B]|uniref:hypothetical protein n=1 Tax=Streptomyces sp. CC224B TaxID=3044571 RepID=UPI0024A83DAB|nr:hypothetical protein [Streptomyces sp. CC224B]